MLLHKSTKEALTSYLREKKFISADQEVLGTEKPGEGNMNYTIRVKLKNDSIIIKQSNPYVEKYPSVPAPQERALAEAAFYGIIADDSTLTFVMPDFIGIDKDNFINAMEDLGQAQDLSYLYQRQEPIANGEIEKLCGYLSILHNEYRIKQGVSGLSNLSLRKLNHEHIFIYPFLEDNGFDLDSIQPGLQDCSSKYKKSAALKEVATDLGEKYLSDGLHLVHGDFYPGSWVKAKKELYIIDPEFCHYGAPEFDLGVMQAHMYLSGNESKLDQIMGIYKKPANFDEQLCNNYIGIEILRRIIGLAQLPLHLSIAEKEAMLQLACENLQIKI